MAKNIRELLELRNKAVTDARAVSDVADAGKRRMNDEEKRQYELHMDDAKRFSEEIDRETELQEAERRNAAHAIEMAGEKEKRGASPDEELRNKAFRRLLTIDSLAGERLTTEEYRALTAGSDTQAGYLNAPQDFVKSLIVAVKNRVFMRGLATNFTTTNANGLGYPTIETDVDDAVWTPEIIDAPEDTALTFGKRELKPHPSKKLIKISDKLLRSDGMDAEAIVMDRASYKYGVTEEKAFLVGTGSQQPLGVFTASAQGISTARDLTMSYSDDFTADDLIKAKYGVKAQYADKATWLFHRDAISKIARLKDGDGRYIFDLAKMTGTEDTLLGRPLKMSEYVPNTFTSGLYVGMFGDFSWYYIATSLALRVQRLNELYAAKSLVGFKFDMECDGMPVLEEAFSRLKTGTSAAP